ncbi:MAG TPA: hypothetical protein VFK66_02800 [Oryzihumus sp.]|nr:hypothetical protein [Oryzihumus sp.]
MNRRIATITAAAAVCLSLSGCGLGKAIAGVHEPPAPVTDIASVTPAQARGIVDRVFTAAGQSRSGSGDVKNARAVAYSGNALTAAVADARLASVAPQVGGNSPAIAPEQPRILALPRGEGFPRVIVVQTVPDKGGLPVLHLVTSPDARTPYRIAESATMLPGSSVRSFTSLASGSRLVTDGKGLAISPQSLLEDYAKGLSFPAAKVANPPYTDDRFATQVRAGAAQQASDVSKFASFTQKHTVQPGSVYAIAQSGGGALVFGVLERTDTFTVKKAGSSLTAPKQFTALVPGKTKLTTKATMRTLEMVVFAVPKGSGQATLVGATEHLVSASGS